MQLVDPALPPSEAAAPPSQADDGDATHEALAARLGARLEETARWDGARQRWLAFDGRVWRPDGALRVLAAARAVCAAAADAAADARAKRRIASAATVAAIERLARADPRLAAGDGGWDRDPWLLATPAGTVDLRSGALRAHAARDRITRIAAVSPAPANAGGGGADCPRFRAFLDRIFARDAALIAFVQRALGYALSGDTSEHALFFCWGTGGNGKGVLLNTVARILGGYAAAAPAESVAAGAGALPAADLAALAGARFVLAPEIGQGEAWNERRLKALTGGDPLAARGGADADAGPCWTSFKLFIAGNHKPTLRSVDAAIRRRLHIIPFAVTIPPAEVDRELPHRLAAEWPAILAWMIAGCREWQRIGLAPPRAVADATAEHLAEEDTFGAWLGEWVTPGPRSATETAAALYGSWETFATWVKEPAGSRKAFAHAMRARGFVPARIGRGGTKGYSGLVLRRHSNAAAMAAALSGSRVPLEGL